MLALLGFVFGAIIGSFLNVLVVRHGAKSVTGRSMCLSCGTPIAWYDNIPVISWLLLRGRCRGCGSRISSQYLIVEVLTGTLFSAVFAALVPTYGAISSTDAMIIALHVLMIGAITALAIYDARHTILPDPWIITFSICALAIALSTRFAPLHVTLLSGPAAAAPLFALWLVSRGSWMGLGDAKLALGIGWFLGPLYGIVAVFLAFVIGALVSVCVLLPLPHLAALARRTGIAQWQGWGAGYTMKSEVAFGPFLVASFFAVWLAQLYQIPLPL